MLGFSAIFCLAFPEMRLLVLALLQVCAWPALAIAQTDSDVDRIPQSVQSQGDKTSTATPLPSFLSVQRLFLEDDFSLFGERGNLPVPLGGLPDWQNRTSMDLMTQLTASPELKFTFSDRLNMTEQDGASPDAALSNDLREAYVTWAPAAGQFFEAGRINVREGVSLGYNPTDFFKAGTAVAEASSDPSVAREGRLGVVMARYQYFWDDVSLSLSFAPKLGSPPIDGVTEPSLNPHFERTNFADRELVTLDFKLADLAPQALVFVQDGTPRFGLNLSHLFSQSVVGYAEWAGGSQRDLIGETAWELVRSGAISSTDAFAIPGAATSRFRNDLTLGFSWSRAESKTTFNLEYQYHGAGLSDADWNSYFGAADNASQAVLSQLADIQGVAAFDENPLARQAVFTRIEWRDGLLKDLTLGGLSSTDLRDGSTAVQFSAVYDVSPAWTIGAYVTFTTGSKRSDYGSLPLANSATAQLVRYF
jgi:hypothetical protein